MLLAACARDAPQGLERMIRQKRYDAWESSRIFADGKTMQPPPAGTVAREEAEEPALGGDSSAAMAPVTPELLARGADRFAIYCAVCHGAAGYGGSIVAANLGKLRPPPLRSPAVRGAPPGWIYQRIRDGVGQMPSYAAELSVPDRWAVVAYVRALQDSGATRSAALEDSTRAASLEQRFGPAVHTAHPAGHP